MPAPRGEKWETDIEARMRRVEQKAGRPLANSGFRGSAPNETTLDGNLVVSDLGRLSFPAGGSLEMKDKLGRQYFYSGGLTSNGFGVGLTRLNGVLALLFSDDDPVNETRQRIRLFDSNGKPLISEDPSGNGADWPLAPIAFTPLSWPTWSSNDGGTFAAISSAYTYKSSPRIYVYANVICDGTATGEVRLMCSGTQLGSTVAVPNMSMTAFAVGPVAAPGNVQDNLYLTLETRVTSGAGKCYGQVLNATYFPSA